MSYSPNTTPVTFLQRYDDTPGAGGAAATAAPSFADLMGGVLNPTDAVVGETTTVATNTNTGAAAGTQATHETVDTAPADNAAAVGAAVPADAPKPTEDQSSIAKALTDFMAQGEQTEGFKLEAAPFVAAMKDVDFVDTADTAAIESLFGDNAPEVKSLFNSIMQKSLSDLLSINLAITEKHSAHLLGEQSRVTEQQTLRGHVSDALGDNATPELVASAMAMAKTIRSVNKDIPLTALAENSVRMLTSASQKPAVADTRSDNNNPSMSEILATFG